jgi:serine/threonine-protein kinase RsbW
MMTRTAHRTLTVPPSTRCLAGVRKVVIETLDRCNFPQKKARLIALAVDEALANVMEHGYGKQPGAEVQPGEEILLALDLSPERFEVTIEDNGRSFEPPEMPEVNIREHVKAGRRGGLGLFLMRRIMDKVTYAPGVENHNVLHMIKYIDGAAEAGK